DEVRAMAEYLGAPVVTTTNGKGVLPEDHPLALGAGVHLPAVRDLVAESDVVLVVGSELAPADLWNGPLPLPGRMIRVDVDAAQIHANAVPEVALVADARLALTDLLHLLAGGPGSAPDAGSGPDQAMRERPRGHAGSAPGDGVARAAGWRDRKNAEARAEGARWLGVVEGLGAALGRQGIVAADSAMVCYYGALANLPVHAPASFLYPTGYGTLGYGLPAAIGAKLARPQARVVALLGDGGVMFTIAELATAAQLRLPLPVVVVDNGGYGEIRAEMSERGDPVHAVDLPSPDFPALARALGCRGVCATTPAELAQAVTAAFDADVPTLVLVPEETDDR
ncbi:thiamine pyrophosphate-binding protein, partial [Actinomadura sp. HBU206391]|uniref:thiamine pyrophosphate-binding protein n=1 Tax=Actinomadura sp. HBU206391 TaxID=2731692 RepID=UPI001DA5C351